MVHELEVFDQFWNFKSAVGNMFGTKIKVLQSEGSEEYENRVG